MWAPPDWGRGPEWCQQHCGTNTCHPPETAKQPDEDDFRCLRVQPEVRPENVVAWNVLLLVVGEVSEFSATTANLALAFNLLKECGVRGAWLIETLWKIKFAAGVLKEILDTERERERAREEFRRQAAQGRV